MRVQWHGASEPPEAKIGDDWREPDGSLWFLTTLGWVDRWGNFRSEVATLPNCPTHAVCPTPFSPRSGITGWLADGPH